MPPRLSKRKRKQHGYKIKVCLFQKTIIIEGMFKTKVPLLNRNIFTPIPFNKFNKKLKKKVSTS